MKLILDVVYIFVYVVIVWFIWFWGYEDIVDEVGFGFYVGEVFGVFGGVGEGGVKDYFCVLGVLFGGCVRREFFF